MARVVKTKEKLTKTTKDKKEVVQSLTSSINLAKDTLKGQAKEIEQKEKLKEELRKETTDMVVFVTDYEAVKEKISEEVSAKQEELKALDADFEEKKLGHHQLIERMATQHADLLQKHDEDIEIKKNEKAQIENECAELSEKAQKIVEKTYTKQQEHDALKAGIAELKKVEPEIQEQIRAARIEQDLALENGNQVSSSLANLKKMYDDDYKDYTDWKKKAADTKYSLESKMTETRKALKIISEELESKMEQIASINRRDEGARAEKERLEKIAKRLGVQLAVI